MSVLKITYKGNSYQIMEDVCDAEAETLKKQVPEYEMEIVLVMVS